MNLPDWVWARHANPKSGWTRVAITPLLASAIYHRQPRLLLLVLGWTVVNPVAFSPPENADSWMTRGVLAERAWLADGNRTVGTDWPNVLNLANAPVTGYFLWATLRKRPVHTVLATVLLAGLKLWWVDEIIEETGITEESEIPAAGSQAPASR
ncbi:DUF6653 family protein [Natronomonas sp. EA1]|uniref:DUF6653 family protein n=1 Tax=Natronomonas sp. EA1 TaxID=3421655 RepID=UPI003EB92A97